MAGPAADLVARALDATSSLVVVLDPHATVVLVNRAFEKHTGASRERIIGRPIWADVQETVEPAAREAFARTLASGCGEEFIAPVRKADGSIRHICWTGEPLRKPTGEIEYIIGTGVDVTDRLRDAQALRDLNATLEHRAIERSAEFRAQSALLRLILDSLSDGVVVCNADRLITQANPAAEQIVGAPLINIRAEEWTQPPRCFHPDGTPFTLEQLPLYHAVHGRTAINVEMLVRHEMRPDGVWLLVSGSPLRDGSSQVIGGVIILHDISEQKKQEVRLRESEDHFKRLAEHNRRLVQELDHRVRNNLAGLQGLISILRDKARTVREFAEAMDSRIAAMSHIHQVLASGGYQAVDLGALVRGTLDALSHAARHSPTLDIDGPRTPIGPRQALPLTMILVEWFTNSVKYGAHSVEGGRLRIAWDRRPVSDGHAVYLRWTERDGPPVPDKIVPSLGTQLIRGFVSRELLGHCVLRYDPQGADHEIEFTLRPESRET